jgi:ribosome-associated protein
MKEDQHGKYIELNAFLKIVGIASTGGRAKLLIRDGNVKVNGVVETRVTNKLRNGFVVECEEKKFTVNLDVLD